MNEFYSSIIYLGEEANTNSPSGGGFYDSETTPDGMGHTIIDFGLLGYKIVFGVGCALTVISFCKCFLHGFYIEDFY